LTKDDKYQRHTTPKYSDLINFRTVQGRVWFWFWFWNVVFNHTY